MTDICDPSSSDNDREKEGDAPATVNSPSVWRSLWALSTSWLGLASRRREGRRSARLHRLNAYMLRDIGVDHDGFVVLDEDNNYR